MDQSEKAKWLVGAMGCFARACKWAFRVQFATWHGYNSKVVLRGAVLLYKCAVRLQAALPLKDAHGKIRTLFQMQYHMAFSHIVLGYKYHRQVTS